MSFKNLLVALKRFHLQIFELTGPVLDRIQNAIYRITSSTGEDLQDMHNVIEKCKSSYDDYFAVNVDSVLYYLNAFYSDLHNMDFILSSTEDNVTEKYTFQSTRIMANNLLLSLYVMRKHERPNPPNQDCPYTPIRLWDDNHINYCQSNYSLMIDIITGIIELLAEIPVNWKPSNRKTNNHNNNNIWSDQLHEYTRQAIDVVSAVKGCSNEYKNVVKRAYVIIQANSNTMKEAFKDYFFYLKLNEILDPQKNDMEFIEFMITYYEDLLAKYSENETGKFDLALFLTVANHSQLDDALSSILARIDTHSLAPFQNMMENLKVNFRKWLHSSLSALATLVPYFDTFIDDEVRKLNIWKYPLLPVDSPTLDRYSKDGYETWSREKSLVKLLENGDDETLFVEILTSYGINVSTVIYEFQTQLYSHKKESIAAFDNLMMDVQSFRQHSNIDKDFIM